MRARERKGWDCFMRYQPFVSEEQSTVIARNSSSPSAACTRYHAPLAACGSRPRATGNSGWPSTGGLPGREVWKLAVSDAGCDLTLATSVSRQENDHLEHGIDSQLYTINGKTVFLGPPALFPAKIIDGLSLRSKRCWFAARDLRFSL